MPASPLAPRRAAHAVEVGGKLLVFGGTPAPACPTGADCDTPTEAPFDDAAAYDPATKSWTELARSPVPIGYASSVVAGDIVYLLVAPFGSSHPSARNAFLSYDATRDRWTELALPPSPLYRLLAPSHDAVVAYQHSQENGIEEDFVYSPTDDTWAELPPDPLRPAYDRWMVWSDAGLVLTGLPHVANPGAERPSLYGAALLNASNDGWKRFPDSEITGYNPEWSWTGERVLNASTERSDGGETNNWGRTYFAGGMLDPRTGEWSALPDVPDGYGGFTGINASGDRYATAGGGWVFDAAESRWLELSKPNDAPEGEAAAAWVGDELFVWGGVRYEGSDGVLLDDGWSWTPTS
jgi:hypothetical protein